MDLMKFRPAFRVVVDGSDVTSLFSDRLVTLVVTDEAGVQSDAVEITLSDTGLFGRLEIPPKGAEVEVWLGYMSQSKYMGLYIADEIEVSGPPDQMRIRASASIHGETSSGKLALTTQRLRSWPDGTRIAALVQQIAGEHGLKPMVSKSLASVVLPHLDQVDESDISLLTRVAQSNDAIAKPAGGALGMIKRGDSLSASGEPLPVVVVPGSAVKNWAMREELRAGTGKVVATYRDFGAGSDTEAEAGTGEPVMRLRHRFSSEAEAKTAAKSEKSRTERAGRQLSLGLVGDPDLIAEGRLMVVGLRAGVDGEWLVRRVTHTVDSSGYQCQVDAEPVPAA